MVEKRFKVPDPLGLFGRSKNPTSTTNPEAVKFLADIKKSVPDEAMANKEYADMASVASRLGHTQIASTLRGMSEDEGRHKRNLEEMLRRIT